MQKTSMIQVDPDGYPTTSLSGRSEAPTPRQIPLAPWLRPSRPLPPLPRPTTRAAPCASLGYAPDPLSLCGRPPLRQAAHKRAWLGASLSPRSPNPLRHHIMMLLLGKYRSSKSISKLKCYIDGTISIFLSMCYRRS